MCGRDNFMDREMHSQWPVFGFSKSTLPYWQRFYILIRPGTCSARAFFFNQTGKMLCQSIFSGVRESVAGMSNREIFAEFVLCQSIFVLCHRKCSAPPEHFPNVRPTFRNSIPWTCWELPNLLPCGRLRRRTFKCFCTAKIASTDSDLM